MSNTGGSTSTAWKTCNDDLSFQYKTQLCWPLLEVETVRVIVREDTGGQSRSLQCSGVSKKSVFKFGTENCHAIGN
jgi:hypothetical protein